MPCIYITRADIVALVCGGDGCSVSKGALFRSYVAPFVDFSMIPARSSSNQKSGIQRAALARAALWLAG